MKKLYFHQHLSLSATFVVVLLITLSLKLSAQTSWHYGGNNVTSPDSSVIGSTNAQCLSITTNDTSRIHIDSIGSISVGYLNQVSGSYFDYFYRYFPAYAIGISDTVNGAFSFGLGYNNNVSGWANIAIGSTNVNSGFGSYSFGTLNTSSAYSAISIGLSNISSAADAMSFGLLNQSTLDGAMCFGDGNISSGYNSYAMGNVNYATAQNAFALGTLCHADDDDAMAIGYSSHANNVKSIAVGQYTTAYGASSIAIGDSGTSYGISSIAIGKHANAYGDNTIKLKGDSIISEGIVVLKGPAGAGSPPPALDVIGNTRIQGKLTVDSLSGSGYGLVLTDPFGNLIPFPVKGIPCCPVTPTYAPCGYPTLGWNVSTVDSNDIIRCSGNVGIGVAPDSVYRLDVCGIIRAKELKVNTLATCDFVFDNCYAPMTIKELDKYVKEKKHLPDIASAKEMEANGINVADMDAKLLQKIEELYLYAIEQDKKMDAQNERIEQLEKQIKK